MLSGRSDEIGQFVRSRFQIFQIEYPFGQSSKEPRHPVLQDFAAWAEQRSIRIKRASKRNEITFVSTRAMQKQQCARRAAGNEFVNEIRLRSHDLDNATNEKNLSASRAFSTSSRVKSKFFNTCTMLNLEVIGYLLTVNGSRKDETSNAP
jgi:hypothetical protein